MVSLATPVDRTLYFDFLPVRLPKIRGYTIRLQLFTVPGQVYYNATRKLVLTGADGVVFVGDSQRERLEANIESLENLKENLREHGISLEALPHIFQYNKRDLPTAAAQEELESTLNRLAAPSFATVATTGAGIFEALEAMTRAVIRDLREKRVLWADDDAPASTSAEFAAQEEGIIQSLLQVSSPRAERAADPAPVAQRQRADSPRPFARPTPASLPPPAALAASAGAIFAPLFAAEELELLRNVEAALGAGDGARVVELVEPAATRELAAAASSAGEGAPRDPLLAALLLGVEGRRYLR